MAIALDDVEPFLPCISDLGVEPPESSLFSLFMNCGSFSILLFVLIRFEAMKTLIEENRNHLTADKKLMKVWNRCSIISGIFMVIGFLIVSNFQNSEGKFVQTAHNVGAILGFFSAVVDMSFQNRLSFGLSFDSTGRFQRFLSLFILLLAVAYYSLSIWSYELHSKALLNEKARLKWNSNQDGYVVHVVSNTMEWVLVLSLGSYFFSFVGQLKRFSLSKQLLVSIVSKRTVLAKERQISRESIV